MSADCCCDYGAAVSGEWPEFECDACPIHDQGLGQSGRLCKRHAQTQRVMASRSACSSWPPVAPMPCSATWEMEDAPTSACVLDVGHTGNHRLPDGSWFGPNCSLSSLGET